MILIKNIREAFVVLINNLKHYILWMFDNDYFDNWLRKNF